MAYDWLATRKPLVVTRPEAEVYLPPSRLLESLTLLAAADAGSAAGLLLDSTPPAELAGLAELYFGDTSPGASLRRFEQELSRAVEDRSAEIAARSDS